MPFISSSVTTLSDNVFERKFMFAIYNICLLFQKSPGKGGRKKGPQKSNLRQAPYHIQDGDVIGIKVGLEVQYVLVNT